MIDNQSIPDLDPDELERLAGNGASEDQDDNTTVRAAINRARADRRSAA